MYNQFEAFRVSTFTQSLSVTSVMNIHITPQLMQDAHKAIAHIYKYIEYIHKLKECCR